MKQLNVQIMRKENTVNLQKAGEDLKKKKKGRENQQSQKPVLLKINKIDKLLANWSRKKVRRQTTLGKEIDIYLAEV